MEDEIHRLVDPDRLADVVVPELERIGARMRDVLERAGVEIVDADHPVPVLEQVVAEVRAEESGATGDD